MEISGGGLKAEVAFINMVRGGVVILILKLGGVVNGGDGIHYYGN